MARKSTFSMSWNSVQVLVPLASALAVVAFCLVGAGKPSETSGRGPSRHGWAEERCQGLGQGFDWGFVENMGIYQTGMI